MAQKPRDMSWAEWTKVRREKRMLNLQLSKDLLLSNDIDFLEHESGFRLVVAGKKGWDFFPTTGAFFERDFALPAKDRRCGRGVLTLLNLILKDREDAHCDSAEGKSKATAEAERPGHPPEEGTDG